MDYNYYDYMIAECSHTEWTCGCWICHPVLEGSTWTWGHFTVPHTSRQHYILV